MDDIELALLDPAAFFETPQHVVMDDRFSKQQKIDILRRWEDDAHLMLTAEDENMPGNSHMVLDQVINALHSLGVKARL